MSFVLWRGLCNFDSGSVFDNGYLMGYLKTKCQRMLSYNCGIDLGSTFDGILGNIRQRPNAIICVFTACSSYPSPLKRLSPFI